MPIIRCECGKRYKVPAEFAGRTVECKKCGKRFKVQLPPEEARAEDATRNQPATTSVCAICRTPIAPAEAMHACPDCGSLYHAECWEENRGCGVYGCSQVPETEPLRDDEMPVSYWGVEEKQCPRCAATIKAAARRCVHCGATFDSGRPVSQQEFDERQRGRQEAPGLQRETTAILIAALIPCLAPLAAIYGTIWYIAKGERIRKLPVPYPVLGKMAVIVAFAQVIFALGAVMMYTIVRGG